MSTELSVPAGDHPDPYLAAMETFAVPPAHESVDVELSSWDPTAELFNPTRYQCVSLIDYYGLHLAIDLVDRLRLRDSLERPCTPSRLVESRGFSPGFETPLEWILRRLAEAGIVRVEGKGPDAAYRLVHGAGSSRLGWLREEAGKLDPGILPTLDMMDAGANGFARVASGERTGERHLWGHFREWQALFSSSNWYYDLNNQIAARAAACRLEQRPLRVLEVGAGLGSGTTALLDALGQWASAPGSSFRITEPNTFMRRRLEAMLRSSHPTASIEFGELDLNRDWKGQGCCAGSFDLVYGVNVFHLATDIDWTLGQVTEALTPGGWLIAGEGLRPFPGRTLPLEVVFVLLQDYGRVRAGQRCGHYGFLSAAEWKSVLDHAGLTRIEVVPDPMRMHDDAGRITFGAVCGRKAPAAASVEA